MKTAGLPDNRDFEHFWLAWGFLPLGSSLGLCSQDSVEPEDSGRRSLSKALSQTFPVLVRVSFFFGFWRN
jgi:hypothetical protein